MGKPAELIAHRLSEEAIRDSVGADTLAYLSYEGMMGEIAAGLEGGGGHCGACFTGRYPLEVETCWVRQGREKLAFEAVR